MKRIYIFLYILIYNKKTQVPKMPDITDYPILTELIKTSPEGVQPTEKITENINKFIEENIKTQTDVAWLTDARDEIKNLWNAQGFAEFLKLL